MTVPERSAPQRRRAVVNLRDDRPAWAFPDWAAERIGAAFGADWEVIFIDAPVSGRGDGSGTSPEAAAAVRGAEVYLGLGLPREILQAATASPGGRLRWAHTGTAGVSSLLYPELLASSIVLTNSAGIHAPPMADTVLAMVLHFARGLDFAVRAQAQGEWGKPPFEDTPGLMRELAGATLGVLGLGGVGRAVAARGAALGMTVLGVRRRPAPTPPHVELLTGTGALETLLRRADYLVLSLPSTPSTRNLLDAHRLALLQPSAVVINVGRGDTMDEEALIAALRAGRLRGAGLDVFREEPLPPESPFWDLPNALITPHVSATTPRFWEREVRLIGENIHRYLTGQPLRNVVDQEAGY